MSEPIDVLFTLDAAYLPHLQVVLTSMHVTSPEERFRAYVLHRDIPDEDLERLAAGAERLNCEVLPRRVDRELFAEAPTTDRYPEEMYYRLLAGQLLPNVERVLYLDPDVLVINPLRPLWETDLAGRAFAAAPHDAPPTADLTENVNNVRLGTQGSYFNSGVLLMDLDAARRLVRPEEVFACVRERSALLILPDQDVLNALYSEQILEVDELVWNYDARAFRVYLIDTAGVADVEWVMANTVVLHFCGRSKPWKPNYPYRFGTLYKHYEQLARRVFEQG